MDEINEMEDEAVKSVEKSDDFNLDNLENFEYDNDNKAPVKSRNVGWWSRRRRAVKHTHLHCHC